MVELEGTRNNFAESLYNSIHNDPHVRAADGSRDHHRYCHWSTPMAYTRGKWNLQSYKRQQGKNLKMSILANWHGESDPVVRHFNAEHDIRPGTRLPNVTNSLLDGYRENFAAWTSQTQRITNMPVHLS